MTRTEAPNQVNNDGTVFSFGEDLQSPFAAQLKSIALSNPEAARLLVDVSQVAILERKATVFRLGGKLRKIGEAASYSNSSFIYPDKNDEVGQELRREWASLEETALLDPEARMDVLKMLPRGLNVSENRKVNRSQLRYLSKGRREWVQYGIVKERPLFPFLDGFDREVNFSDSAYITLEALLELSDYPNPVLDSFQSYLASIHANGDLVNPKSGFVELPTFLQALSDWLPTLAEQPK